MTNKDELIKALQTLKSECDEHEKCKDCLLAIKIADVWFCGTEQNPSCFEGLIMHLEDET